MPNHRFSRRLAAPAALVALAASTVLSGCTPPPKIVRHVTAARDQIKFLYTQGDGQGVLKCQVGPDGALSQCRDITVALDD